MKRKQIFSGLGAFVGMLILILDGKTTLAGAQTGIELCLRTVIPSLFPFFILSILLTRTLSGASLPALRPFGKLLGIPKGAESILISGFLGGYPVGAQCISGAYHAGQLSKEDAQRMLGFCNNAGPAFIFGMVSAMFPSIRFSWALWGIHIAGAVGAALYIPRKVSDTANISVSSQVSMTEVLNSAIHTMAIVCGWVMLFRVIIAFWNRWVFWIVPVDLRILLTGLLELSNGCCELNSVTILSSRFLICSILLSFGGLCVTMQTIAVTKGLSLRTYFFGKLLQTLISVLLCTGIIFHIWIPSIVILILILWKNQKKSSIQQTVGV